MLQRSLARSGSHRLDPRADTLATFFIASTIPRRPVRGHAASDTTSFMQCHRHRRALLATYRRESFSSVQSRLPAEVNELTTRTRTRTVLVLALQWSALARGPISKYRTRSKPRLVSTAMLEVWVGKDGQSLIFKAGHCPATSWTNAAWTAYTVVN